MREEAREFLIARRKKESNGELVAVRDSGLGLDLRSVDRLFEAFSIYQGPHRGARRADVGPARMEPGGASFQFTLPLERDESVPAGPVGPTSVRAVKHGNAIWRDMQLTRNRARSQRLTATARKQSAAGRTSPRRKSKSADRTTNPQSVAVRQTHTARPAYRGRIRTGLKCHSATARSQSPT